VTSLELLQRYVELHNQGVRGGNFDRLVSLFATDGELRFEGRVHAVLTGSAAIATAFGEMPPDDELHLDGARRAGEIVQASYRWARDVEKLAGSLTLEAQNGKIRRLVVTIG
jgi:hypothetical protein